MSAAIGDEIVVNAEDLPPSVLIAISLLSVIVNQRLGVRQAKSRARSAAYDYLRVCRRQRAGGYPVCAERQGYVLGPVCAER